MRKFFRSKLFLLILLLALIVAFFAVQSQGKSLGLVNIRSILNLILTSALLAIGAAYLMISGNLDLSAGAVGTLCGIVMALMLRAGIPWPVAVVASLLLGGAVGFINAVLINELNFQGFIATMAIASVAEGFAYFVSNSKAVSVDNATLSSIANGKFLNNTVPYAVIGVLALLLIYGIILSYSKFGRQIYLVGGNPRAAYLAGINPKKMSYKLFINSAFLSALAGCLFTAQLKSGTLTGILSSQMSGITAVMLGGISFGGGSGGMAGAFVGLLILNVFSNGLTILGMNPYWKTFASGALLLAALTLDVFTSRRKAV
jgi:ribose transport system permease protein